MTRSDIPTATGRATMTLVAAGTATVHYPLPEDHPFYAKIGRVAAEWARFEHLLDLIIWGLSGVDGPVGAAITAQMLGSTNRLKSVIALGMLKKLKKQTIEAVTKLLRVSYDPGDARNRIVHDSWFIQPTTGQIGQFRAMAAKDLRYGLVDIDEKEVETLLTRIQQLAERAHELREQISSELQASREKRRQPRP